MAERFVVLGVAHARSSWFADVGRWSTNGTLAVEFVKALSVDEVRLRLDGGRPFSAVLLDGALHDADRDLFAAAASVRCPVLVVDDSHRDRWVDLGAVTVLPSGFPPSQLADALDQHAEPIAASRPEVGRRVAPPEVHRAPLVAVLGAGGAGTSTVAIAIAQGLGHRIHAGGDTVLVDGQFDADHALLHDTGDVVPGLLELVDAHRTTTLGPDEVWAMSFGIEARRYRLVLGLRRRRDWTAFRPRAVEAAVDGLRRSFGLVVADVDSDLDGEPETGSFDVEDRSVIARSMCRDADLVVVVSRPGVAGIHRLVHLVVRLLAFGVPGDRIVSIVNRTPTRGGARREVTKAVASLLAAHDTTLSPVFVAEAAALDRHHREVTALPDSVVAAVCDPIVRRLASIGQRAHTPEQGPEPIAPGSLGTWHEEVA